VSKRKKQRKKDRKNIKRKKIFFNYKKDNGLLCKFIFSLYRHESRVVRNFLLGFLYRYLGTYCEFFSQTLRKIFTHYYRVSIGLYTHGCFSPGNFGTGITIGRFCSIAKSAVVLNANHPMNLKSSHGFFFNPSIGLAEKDFIPRTKTTIGNDVWIGHNAVILPSCSSIGDGAVIGAGAIVNKNIPPYAVVLGNPARVVRYRFSEEMIKKLLESKWWEKSFEELEVDYLSFQQPLESEQVR
jgi:virginiamycin A acetyltransferase